jgi:hypothetical protein
MCTIDLCNKNCKKPDQSPSGKRECTVAGKRIEGASGTLEVFCSHLGGGYIFSCTLCVYFCIIK